MRILQLGKFYPIRGGVEKVMWDLTQGLASQDVACDMLCCLSPGAGIDGKDLPRHRQEGRIHYFRFSEQSQVICVPCLAKMAATMLSPAMLHWLRKQRNAYDIIHIHHPDPMAALALRLSGFKGKVVLHWHSDILSQQFLLKVYRPLQTWLIKRADVIIGTTPVYLQASPWLKEVQDKCQAVPIGILPVKADAGRVAAIRERFKNQILILSIGRLIPYKGFSVLINAAKFLPDNYHLAIGGKGPLMQALQEQIKEGGLEGRVSLEGYLSDEDIPAWFQAADVFVLSSILKTEAFGIVQIEAMSCGTPVVSTIIEGSGVSWVNQHEVSGLTVPTHNPEELSRAIVKVASQARHYGDGARQLFEERYTLAGMIRAIREIYRTL